MRLDNFTARLEAKEQAKGSSSVLDTIRDVQSSMPPTIPSSDPSSSVKPSTIVEGVAIFVEEVVDDDEWTGDDLAEETNED
uniref:Polyprotein protein n=1 Tax=Solanum tuberosum TaxID=4113 RepID=M1DML4_SOLTU